MVRKLPLTDRGLLNLTRVIVRNEYGDGRLSRPYRFEMVERRGVDSVAVIAFHQRRRQTWVVLKAGFRPTLYLRGCRKSPADGVRRRPLTVEAVAGSLEPGDWTEADIDRRAVSELAEETGFQVHARDLISLGAGFFPSHGQCTEKIHLRAVKVNPGSRSRPPGDGSVNESETWTLLVEAGDLLRRSVKGEIEDPKIEIGVRRLLERLKGRIAASRRKPASGKRLREQSP